MGRNISLGVHIGHDACASLLIDNRLVADVQEERFNGVKHSFAPPIKSIEYCLKEAGITSLELSNVAFSCSKYKPLHYLLFPNLAHPPIVKKRRIWPRSTDKPQGSKFFELPGKKSFQGSNSPSDLSPLTYQPNFKTDESCQFHLFDHHLCHAASAYCSSPFFNSEKALSVIIDGNGEGKSLSVYSVVGNRFTELRTVPKSHSIGWFYSLVTEGLGYVHLGGEGTVMGLAAYGRYDEQIKEILKPYCPKIDSEHRVFNRLLRYDFDHRPHFHFPQANSLHDELHKYPKENVAATVQQMLEDFVLNLLEDVVTSSGSRKITFAGGVIENIKLNQKIKERFGGENCHFHHNPGDSGLALGSAALAHDFTCLDRIDTPYTGPAYSSEMIVSLLQQYRLPFIESEDICSATAKVLSENKSVGWFQGRMENGPRALGNRSILMSAATRANLDVLNKEVKYREEFRPFCPSILSGCEEELLENQDGKGRFMIQSYKTTKGAKTIAPAIVHADETTRPQIVYEKDNPLFYKLLLAFKKLTKSGVIINTSLNIKGKPICESPKQAIQCFFSSGLDVLVLGNCILSKDPEMLKEFSE